MLYPFNVRNFIDAGANRINASGLCCDRYVVSYLTHLPQQVTEQGEYASEYSGPSSGLVLTGPIFCTKWSVSVTPPTFRLRNVGFQIVCTLGLDFALPS
jgi:hypothetical protein